MRVRVREEPRWQGASCLKPCQVTPCLRSAVDSTGSLTSRLDFVKKKAFYLEVRLPVLSTLERKQVMT